MHSYLFLPPLSKPSGGLAMLLRLGAFLHRAGHGLSFVIREDSSWLAPGGLAERVAPDVPRLRWDGGELAFSPTPEDIWLCPEGWPHALLPGLKAGCRVVLYVQNWAYLLSAWPGGSSPASLPLHYMAVSRPVAWYVGKMTGKRAEYLPAGIDLSLFAPSSAISYGREGTGTAPRVAWMPRKNKAQAGHVREIVDAGRLLRGQNPVEWVEIHNRSQEDVAALLRSCHVFLATGFPEGFALPPLEAMACGCACVGFSGFGGMEYMRQVPDDPGFGPGQVPLWFPEQAAVELEPRLGNGIWVSDGDVLGAALGLEKVLERMESGSLFWKAMLAGGRATAGLYGLDNMEKHALEIWRAAAAGELFIQE